MHIVPLANPNGRASYALGGTCGAGGPCVETHVRAESPSISTLGYNGLTLEFDFISVGDGLLDNCEVLYNVGGGWLSLSPSIKSLTCAPGDGTWTLATFALPATANNIADLRIGFNWVNNQDAVGADPSVAINNVRVIAPRIFAPAAC